MMSFSEEGWVFIEIGGNEFCKIIIERTLIKGI
jgi:hypothetical protein